MDAAGRHGVGIARVDKQAWVATEWVFDRDSLAYLGERELPDEGRRGGQEGGRPVGVAPC